jgi:hypothetical protein
MPERDTKPVESSNSVPDIGLGTKLPTWIKVGVVAAASVVAGGLAAAWFYRKTLHSLRNAEQDLGNPDIQIPEDDPGDDF